MQSAGITKYVWSVIPQEVHAFFTILQSPNLMLIPWLLITKLCVCNSCRVGCMCKHGYLQRLWLMLRKNHFSHSVRSHSAIQSAANHFAGIGTLSLDLPSAPSGACLSTALLNVQDNSFPTDKPPRNACCCRPLLFHDSMADAHLYASTCKL